MRKSQIKIKLFQKQWYKAKKLAIEAFLQKLIKQKEVKNSVQDLYSINLLNQLDIKLLQ